MNDNSYYTVSYSWHEDYFPTIVFGPLQDNWQEYCNSLLPMAVNKALSAPCNVWIGWNDLVRFLVEVLEELNYKVVDLEDADYFGSNIIGKGDNEDKLLSADDLSRLTEHNKKLEEKMHAELGMSSPQS